MSNILAFLLAVLLFASVSFGCNFSQNSEGVGWAMGCDFEHTDGQTGNLKNVRSRGEQCSSLCQSTPSCTHFTWTPYEGGTCWMKWGRITRFQCVPSSPSNVCGVNYSAFLGWSFPPFRSYIFLNFHKSKILNLNQSNKIL